VPAAKPKPVASSKPAAIPKPQPLPAAPPAQPEAASVDLQPGPATGLALPAAPEPLPAAPAEADATPHTPSAGDAPAAYLSGTPPVYPEQARRRGWEGTVLLRVQLDADGRVQTVTVLRSSGYPVLDQAAVSQIASWRFKPSLHDGKPQPSTLRVPVKFRLEQP
jgi:protein TonB